MLEFIPSRFYIHAFTIPWLVFGHDLFGKSTSSTQVVFCIALKCCILFLLFKQLFRQAHHWHHFCISIWSFSGPSVFQHFLFCFVSQRFLIHFSVDLLAGSQPPDVLAKWHETPSHPSRTPQQGRHLCNIPYLHFGLSFSNQKLGKWFSRSRSHPFTQSQQERVHTQPHVAQSEGHDEGPVNVLAPIPQDPNASCVHDSTGDNSRIPSSHLANEGSPILVFCPVLLLPWTSMCTLYTFLHANLLFLFPVLPLLGRHMLRHWAKMGTCKTLSWGNTRSCKCFFICSSFSAGQRLEWPR